MWKVDKWLARAFFPNRVPAFERNDETLAYLYSLSTISNQRTKEKLALLAAQKGMIEIYRQHSNKLESTLKAAGLGLDSLDAKTLEMLQEMADTADILKVDPLNVSSLEIAKAISDQIDREHDLELRLHEMKALQMSLESELAGTTALKTRLEQVQQIQDAQQDTIDEKISEWTRGIKLLQAKTEEYQSRTMNSKVRFQFNGTYR